MTAIVVVSFDFQRMLRSRLCFGALWMLSCGKRSDMSFEPTETRDEAAQPVFRMAPPLHLIAEERRPRRELTRWDRLSLCIGVRHRIRHRHAAPVNHVLFMRRRFCASRHLP
jgi:hypothetical protein